MEAMEALFIVFGVLLLIAGYEDMKRRMVRDILTAAMWVVGALYGNYSFMVWLFAITYMYNALAYQVSPKYGFGWADILVLPVYVAFLYGLGGITAVFSGVAISSVLSLAYIFLFKKGAPYVMALAASYVLVLFAGL
jgi:hypothetical protein